MQRVLIDSAPTLSASFYDGEDSVDVGDVTVTLRRVDGTALLTDQAADKDDQHRYTVTLVEPLDTLENLTATWTATVGGRAVTTEVQVVGGFICELHELRAQRDIDNRDKFPTADLERVRTTVETVFEDYCGVAFVPRAAAVQMHSRRAGMYLQHPRARAVSSIATSTGEALELDGVTVLQSGLLYVPGRLWLGDDMLTVTYTHGYDAPPADIREAALTYARHRLLEEKNRQLSQVRSRVFDQGVELLSTPDPDRGRATGLLDVDATLNRYRADKPLAIA